MIIKNKLYFWGIAAALSGAVFFSAKAVFVKLLYREGIDAIDVIGLRMLLSMPFFLIVWAWTHRQTPRLALAEVLILLLLGTMNYFFSSYFDFLGLQYITAGLERLILYLSPSFVLLLQVFWTKKPVSKTQWISMGLAYFGIGIVFWRDLSLNGANVALGAFYVVLCALIYALYFVLSGQRVQRIGSMRFVGIAMSGACFFTMAFYAANKPFLSLFVQTPAVWQLSFLHATISTAIPVFLVMYSVKALGAGIAAQVGMVGPVSMLVLAFYFLGEPITGLQIIGTAFVLFGIFLLTLKKPQPENLEN